MDWAILICALILGVISGASGVLYILSSLFGGTLQWVTDDDGVYPYIEGTKPFGEITKHDYVIFKVAKNTDAIMTK